MPRIWTDILAERQVRESINDSAVTTRKLINTRDIELLIELAIFSGRLANADPLSLIISSKVGAGKTELVKQYAGNKGVHFTNKTTAWGLETNYLDDIQSGKIRTLIIGDLLEPLSMQRKTRESFFAFMNTIIEEGVSNIAHYGMFKDYGRPARCGLITTIASTDFARKSRRWYEIGFLSRALPVTYAYSAPSRVAIYEEIAGSKSLKESHFKELPLPSGFVCVEPNVKLNLERIKDAMRIEKWEDVYGFRMQTQLQTLMMANALRDYQMSGENGNGVKVRQKDYDVVTHLLEHINMEYKEI